ESDVLEWPLLGRSPLAIRGALVVSVAVQVDEAAAGRQAVGQPLRPRRLQRGQRRQLHRCREAFLQILLGAGEAVDLGALGLRVLGRSEESSREAEAGAA